MTTRRLKTLSTVALTLACSTLLGNSGYQKEPAQELKAKNDRSIFSLEADLLFWQVGHDALVYTMTNTDKTVGDQRLIKHGKEVRVDPKWDPGFRFGVRMQPKDSAFDYRAKWTTFHTRTVVSKKSDSSESFLENVWTTPSLLTNAPFLNNGTTTIGQSPVPVLITNAKAQFSHTTNWVDVNMGRTFRPYEATWVSVRPHAGFRWYNVHERLRVFLTHKIQGHESIVQSNKLRNHFWGVGPRIGFDTEWGFENGKGPSLFASCATTLLVGKFDTKPKQYVPESDNGLEDPEKFYSEINFHSTKSMVDLDIGIAWEIIRNNYAMSFKIGYENHHIMNLAQFSRMYSARSGGDLRNHGDLFYHGAFLNARIDF